METTNRNVLTIKRIFDAPRQLVWEAWTEPESLKLWWGPKGFTSPVATIDLHVGGKFLGCMRSPDGKEFWSTGIYREIARPERIVMTDSFADPEGNVVPASYYGIQDDMPMELLVTVSLEERGGKTMMTLTHAGIPAGQLAEMTKQGWNESFDKLARNLKKMKLPDAAAKTVFTVEAGKPEIVAMRVFDAPRELVFALSTDPNLIARWWGPERVTTTVEKMQLWPGGAWRFIQQDPEGNQYAFNGRYREVKPPERLVQTFEYEGMPGSISVQTMTLEELDGRTLMMETVVFASAEERDAVYSPDMESGWSESHDRLSKLLKKEKASITRKMKKVAAPAQRRGRAR